MATSSAGASSVRIQKANPLQSYFALAIILLCFVAGYIVWLFIMGAPGNFENGDPNGHPVKEGLGSYLGLVYKGGILVGTAIALVLMTITFTIERIISLSKASGTGSMDVFVKRVQIDLESGNIDKAIQECDKQRGSVGNVVKSALVKYKEMMGETGKDKEARSLAIQKALEEAVALEIPVLQRNMVILSTIVSVATLVGLIGTVLGMIKSFAALATSGAPDAVALANGISEALINTALGISTSTIATVSYNAFSSKIEGMTYRMDEAGFSIIQTFQEKVGA